jgi:hypothetical protein
LIPFQYGLAEIQIELYFLTVAIDFVLEVEEDNEDVLVVCKRYISLFDVDAFLAD